MASLSSESTAGLKHTLRGVDVNRGGVDLLYSIRLLCPEPVEVQGDSSSSKSSGDVTASAVADTQSQNVKRARVHHRDDVATSVPPAQQALFRHLISGIVHLADVLGSDTARGRHIGGWYERFTAGVDDSDDGDQYCQVCAATRFTRADDALSNVSGRVILSSSTSGYAGS